MSRLVMKDGKIVMEDDNSQKNAAQKTNSQGPLSMKDGKIVMAQQTPAVNAQKNAQYLARTRAAQNAYLEQDRIPTRPTRDNVMDMAINSLRNRVANSTIGRAANEWASRVSGNVQNVLNESPEVRAAKRQARADNEARRQQWAIDNANIIDQASSQYEGPTRTETVRGKFTDTEGADMFSNDWEPGEEKEIEYTRTVRNENYNPLSREDRDALISRYADAMNGNTDANGYQQTLYDVTKNGGIEQLYKEQQADAANDREYGRQLRGVDLDSMNFWQRLGGTLGGTVAGAGEQIASSGVGLAVSGLNREAGIATQEFGPALEQTARRWFYALANGAEDDPAVEEQIRTLASYVGVDADTLVSRVKDRAEQARNSDEDQAVFAYGLLDGLEADQDKIWENAQQAIADAGFYDTINNLQQKSAEHIQYAKDVNRIQNQFGDNLVEAGVSTIQNAADAAMAATLGLSGTGIVAMIPFALRAYGGTYAEQMQQATELGGVIGQDVAKKAAQSAGLSSAIEVGTEMMWGMVGAMSKVTGGGALDDAAQQRLTEILSGWAKTETGRKILTTVGEKALGGITEGLEEVIGDAAEQILKNAGIMPGEGEEFSEWMKNAGHSFVTGALGGLLGEVTSVVSSPLQKSQIGKQLKAGGLDISLNELADLANSEGMENTSLAKVYNDTFSGMPRNIESISDLEAGKLYEAYEEMLGKRSEAIDRIEQMQAKVEAGETLTRADVNRITNNSDAVSILAESGAVNEDAFSGGINERRDAVEMALRAFANDSTALSDAQAENVQAEAENANTAVSEPNPFLTMSNNAIDNIVRNAQPMSPAQSIRESNTSNMLAGNVLRSAARVVDAAERLNVSERGQDVMARMYSPNMDAIDYVGEMTKYYNQGKEGKTFDVGSIEGVSAIQAQAAFNAGRQEYIERSNNGEEGLRVRTSSERQNGQSAGGSVGVLEESTGAAQGRQTGSFQREGGNARVSAESLRTEGAKAIERSGLRIVTNDSSVAAAKKYAEDRGVNFVAYAGGALNIDGVQSRGYYDSDTNTVYVRADHRLFTAEQIAKHETTHAQIHNGKITLGEVNRETVDFATVRDALVKELTQERFDEMVDAYVEMYAGTNLSRQDIFEELICDSVAGMNDFVSVGHLEEAVKFAPSMSKAKAVTEENAANGDRAGPTENGGWKRYSADQYDPETASIKEQIANSAEVLNKMPVIKSLDNVMTKFGSKRAATEWALKELKKWGGHVDRQGFGNVYFSDADIRDGLNYSNTDAEMAAIVMLPYVLKQGIQVGEHGNHKNRKKHTTTFAGPVEINGTRGNMAVVVNNNGNHYYTHRIVMPDGSTFVFGENKGKASREPYRGVAANSSLANTTRLASVTTVAEESESVNKAVEKVETTYDAKTDSAAPTGSFSREIDSYLQEQHKEYKDDEVNRRIAEEGVRDLIKGFERISASGGEVDMAKQRRDIRTLGNGISAQFVKTGRVNLNGTRIRSAEDLAQVGQIFRNPKFETLRYLYVKKGKIVGTDSVTAMLPGISPAFSKDFQEVDLIKKIARTGADGVYLLHNHPSGDVTPSRQDFGVTGKLAETIQNNTKAKFMGHVVIDHETYAQIDVDTNKRTASWEQNTIPGQSSFDFLLAPSLDNENLGKEVLNAGAIAAVGKEVVNSSGYSAIIYASSKGYVRQLQEVSDKALKNNKQIGNYIRNQRVNSGAGMAFVYTKDRDVYDALVQVYGDDILTDVVLDGAEFKEMRKNVFQREGMYMGVKEGEIGGVHANEDQTEYSYGVTQKELNEYVEGAYSGTNQESIEAESVNGNYSRDFSNTELYEANRQLEKDLTELRNKLKTRTEQYKYWKGQTKVTEGRRLRLDDVTRLAREIIKGQDSSADAKTVAEKMKALGEYILNSFDENVYDEARLKAYEVARDILSSAKVLNTKGGDDFYSDFRTALKNQPIYVSPSVRAEVAPDGWNDFRKAQFGTINMTADQNKGKSVDIVYHDLQATFGEWLLPEYITSEADQLNRILEVIETYRPVYENLNSYEMADAVEWTANEILTRIIGEEIRETNPTYADRMEKKLADQKAKAQTALKQVRQQRDRKVADLKAHYQQVAEDRRNRKIDSEMRTRLLNIAKRLNNKKLDRATRALLDQYIGELDLVSKGILGRTVKELETLRDWYDNWVAEQKAELGEDFVPDSAIENRIIRLSKKRINDLTQEEVADLTTVLLNLEHTLRTQHEFIDSEERRDTYAAAMAFREDYQEGKSSTENAFARAILFGLSGKNKESGGDGLLTPERAMHRLGNYNDDDPGYKLGKELSAGQRKMLDYQMRANALFDAWLKDKKFIDSLAGKNAKWITVKGLVKGELTDVRITPAMRMSLYLHAKNEQNLNHIERGGVLIPNEAKYKKGELNNAYKENYGTHATFSRYMIHEIAKGMSEKEKAFADMAYWYFNNMSKDAINETSEKHKGYAIATVEKYFPIESSRDFLKADFGMLLQDGSVAGQGFLNERNVKSTNPIMLYDMNDVLTKSIAGHSRYYGLALPVQNLNKMMNVIMLGQEGSIRNMLLDEHVKYIDKMVRDVQTGAPGVGGFLAALRSNYAGGVLVLNGGVAVKQAASYPTAAAVLGYMPLVKALKDRNKKVDLNLIAKYTPLLWYRSKGYSTAELGDIGNRGGIASKVTNVKQLNWIQGVDVWTTTKLWTAAEYYVRDNNKALTYGTDAFYKAVAEVYNRVIEETQPNYTAMQRPGILRSDNQLTRALNMFKTQPFQNANILIDAYGNMRAKSRQNKANPTAENTKALKDARKNFARAVTSQALSAFTFALMQAIWDMARGKFKKYKDDDDEATFWSVNKQLLLNMIASLGGMAPYGGTFLEFLESSVDDISKLLGGEAVFDQKFYGFSENSLEAANDLGNTTKSLLANVIKTFLGNQTGETSARNIVDGLSTLIHMSTGLPAPNVVKDMQVLGLNAWRFYERFNGGWDEKSRLMAEYASLRVTTDPAKYKSDYYALLKKAWTKDQAAYEELRKMMIEAPGDPFATSSKTAEQNIDAKVKEWIKEKAQQSEAKQTFYGTVYDEMTANSLWDKAPDAAKDKALEKLLSLALEMGAEGSDKNGAKYKAAIEGGASVGLDATEYMLYTLALSMANPDGGTAKNAEYEEAINMVPGLSAEEKSYLWSTTHDSDKNNPWR